MMCLAIASSSNAQNQNSTKGILFLVHNGKTRSVFVVSGKPSLATQEAIDEFQYHLKCACGVSLNAIDEKAAAALPAETVRFFLPKTKHHPTSHFKSEVRATRLFSAATGTKMTPCNGRWIIISIRSLACAGCGLAM